MAEEKRATVSIINGAGTDPIVIDWQPGDTRDKVLKRANIVLPDHCTASVNGRALKRGHDKIKAGDVIVIANRPHNGGMQ